MELKLKRRLISIGETKANMQIKDLREHSDWPSAGPDCTELEHQAISYYCCVNFKGSPKVQATLLKSRLQVN